MKMMLTLKQGVQWTQSFITGAFLRLKRYIEQTLPQNTLMPQAVLVFDSLLSFLSLFLAVYLRIGQEFLEYTPAYMLKNMLVFAMVTTSILLWMQTHKAIWRYISMEDMVPLAFAAVFANIVFFPLMLLMAQQESLPRSIPLINVLVLVVLLALPRFIYRMSHERHIQQKRRMVAAHTIPVMIIGNGDETDHFIREVLHSPDLPYDPVVLVTTDPEEVGRKIHGVPILGTIHTLKKALTKVQRNNLFPKQIIVTHPDLSDEDKQLVCDFAAAEGLTMMHMLHYISLNPVEHCARKEGKA